jgi:hypothetical protein
MPAFSLSIASLHITSHKRYSYVILAVSAYINWVFVLLFAFLHVHTYVVWTRMYSYLCMYRRKMNTLLNASTIFRTWSWTKREDGWIMNMIIGYASTLLDVWMYTCLYAWHVSAKKNKSIFRGWSILSCEKITFASETILLFQKLWIPIPPRSPRSRGSILLSMRKIWFRQRATYSDTGLLAEPSTNRPQFRTDGEGPVNGGLTCGTKISTGGPYKKKKKRT